jgi:hypothetical protein
MEEENANDKKDYVKVLNPEKVLEFKKNNSSDMDEAEIIIENISQENIISKIYINNYSHFKCTPNIVMINKNSPTKIKVVVDDKNYKVSNSDVFLIISHPVKEQVDDGNLNTFFKNNSSFKEKGQKLFLIGYKKEEKIDNASKDDKLINKIKELEKQVFEKSEEDILISSSFSFSILISLFSTSASSKTFFSNSFILLTKLSSFFSFFIIPFLYPIKNNFCPFSLHSLFLKYSIKFLLSKFSGGLSIG